MQTLPDSAPAAERTSRQPEQAFFKDPAIDRLLGMVMTLSAEVWVLSDRMRSIEHLLDTKGVLNRADLDTYQPDAETAQAIAADRNAFVKALMDHVISRQQSRGA
ncbi:MAG: hypothetical protein RL458_1430 [Pseudomonadota bacterium]|jgi:hypothetical protein